MALDIRLINRTRFAKLSILAADVYSKQLQCIAEHNVRADIALNICKSNPALMKSLTKAEKNVLPSLASDGYSNCDPTLMYKILRNILPPPRVGWDRNPGLTDITISDDVQRIRILRNKIVHRTGAELSKQEEEHIIPQSLDIAKRLDCYLNRNSDEKFEAWIIKILSRSIDKKLEDEYVERGLKIEDLTNALEVIEGNYTLQLKSGKNLKLLLANELWEEEVKPDGIGIVAEVTGFNKNEDQQIVEYLNEHCDKINEGKTLVVLKKARLGNITLFLQLLEIVPEEKLYQQIVDVMRKLFQELAFQLMTTKNRNVDIMLFPDEFLIKDDFSDKADGDDTGKKSLILDLAVNSSSVKDGSGFVHTISDFIGHIITQTNFIHNKCETTDSDELSTLKNRGDVMSSIEKERENFFRNAILVIDHSKAALISLIELDLRNNHLTFEQFLNQSQHDIYHLCYNNRCCRCLPGSSLPRQNRFIFPSQMEGLFDKAAKMPGHRRGPDFCCSLAKKGICTDVIDLTLARCLLVNCCTDVFWYSCLQFHGISFEDFLNQNKHLIYHLWQFKKGCCHCPKHFQLPVNRQILNTRQWNSMFTGSTGLPVCRKGLFIEGANCICSFSAINGISQGSLDAVTQQTLLEYCCSNRKSVETLVKIKNNVYGHTKEARISDSDYTRFKNDIESALLEIAAVCRMEPELKTALHGVNQRSLDRTLLVQYQNSLLDSKH
ncbi:Hypothetical predicted protein, partial [Mytilus galloprovincialis]